MEIISAMTAAIAAYIAHRSARDAMRLASRAMESDCIVWPAVKTSRKALAHLLGFVVLFELFAKRKLAHAWNLLLIQRHVLVPNL